jgi:hypothetical protein
MDELSSIPKGESGKALARALRRSLFFGILMPFFVYLYQGKVDV